MKQVTETIVNAFLHGIPKKVGNTMTDGRSMKLFGNTIAEHRQDGLYISNAGWFTKTTKERLNGLPMINISQKKHKWYVNGQEWDGDWLKVADGNPPSVTKEADFFDESTTWVSTDAWRGYSRPSYAVVGANDTGMWDDSPCRSDVAVRELEMVTAFLKGKRIRSKVITCETSNVFCVHHYVIVRPSDYESARELVAEYYSAITTQLLYIA